MDEMSSRQLAQALKSVATAYQKAGKAVPSLSKLTTALESTTDQPLNEFLTGQLARKAPARRAAGGRAPAPDLSARVEYYKERVADVIAAPGGLDELVDALRTEARSRAAGTMNKAALEALSREITGSQDKYPSIDKAVDSIRQRIIEKINAKRSLEHSRDHKAY